MIDTVILDFHGTLTDHNKRITESIRMAGGRLGMQGFASHVRAGIFADRQHLETLESYLLRKGEEFGVEWGLDLFIKHTIQIRNEIYLPVDGIKETFQRFKNLGTRILVMTNGTVRSEDSAAVSSNHPSYSYIIWDKLVEWGLYTGAEDDMPFIIALKDDCRFLNETNVIAKPHPLVAKTVASSIVTCLGGDYDPDRTLLVGDYDDDVKMAKMLGCYCAYFLKGNGQLRGGIEGKFPDISEEYQNRIIALYNIRELPYLCQLPNLSREVTYNPSINSLEISGQLSGGEYKLLVPFDDPTKTLFAEQGNPEFKIKLA